MSQDSRFDSAMNEGSQAPESPTPQLNLNGVPMAAARLAGFWVRFVANAIDMLIIGVASFPIMIVAVLLSRAGAAGVVVGGLINIVFSYFVVPYFYYGWFYSSKGATPGKMLLGLRVLNAQTGSNISYGRAWCREIPAKILSALVLMIGYIMAGVRSDKRALHDLICDTQVIRTK